ncbi:late embryogenesis abundant protein D-34 [Cinnamomum micranthum f. kanehirae]|uniref:Late embryogenesis abundant protein D-34 n=1 Tax=Cinnamomum micranthum f. kanehirae TaxID=337451 RepID=A0A443NUM3_9MAGN|nr:late embryogenesis abundant protein D-34 [Cinnamomum micranthum f. kanehirae]
MRATGRNVVIPRGIGAAAQSAATANTNIFYDSDKTTLADVLTDATKKMVGDMAATREDAVGIRNNPRMETHPGGVAASVATAANLNLVKNPNVEESDMHAAEYLTAFR